jgi:putative addiction module component (TIGR02574 family)
MLNEGITMNTKELIAAAIELPVEERALMVDSLLKSLNVPKNDIDEKWASLAEWRLDDLRSGRVNAIAGDEVFNKIWQRLGSDLFISPRSGN